MRDLEALDFFACALDLEDELIRAAGPDIVEGVLADHRDLLRFRTFQRQPAQRGRPIEAQLRRFAGTASGRKTWFAADVVEVLPLDRVPAPMAAPALRRWGADAAPRALGLSPRRRTVVGFSHEWG